MNQPEQQQINHWLAFADKWIPRKKAKIASGEIKQSIYTSLAIVYASFARTKFLNGDPIGDVHTEFVNAARCVLKSFTMAYDKSDADYVGDKWPARNPNYTGQPNSPVEAKWLDPVYGQVDWSCVSETTAIRGFNYALMAADFDLAAELASWYQDRPDDVHMDIDVQRYTHALKQTLLGDRRQAKDLLKAQWDDYTKKPPKSAGDKNYYTLITALNGIVEKDEAQFNEGLSAQLKFYQGDAQGENKNNDEEFICDHAVALANLGLHYGLAVTVEHDTLPKGLLVQA